MYTLFSIYSTASSQNSVNSQNPTSQQTPDPFLIDYSQQVLTIEDVQPTEDLTIVQPIQLGQQLVNTGREARDHTIKDFITRPRVIYQGSIPAGGSNNELIVDLKFPDALLTLEPIREKLKGFQYLRSDTIIKINFTAPPTVSGSFRGLIIPDISAAAITLRTRDLVSSSQFPNKIINIAKMPSLEFTLPWVSPYTHRNLMNTEGSSGSFQLRRIFPSSDVIKVIIFASFDVNSNFDLSQPTPAIPLFNPLTISDSDKILLDSISKFTPGQFDKFQKLVRFAGRAKREDSSDDLSAHSLNSITTQCKHIYDTFSNYFSNVGHPRLVNTTAVQKRKLAPAAGNINYNEPQISHSFGMNSNNFVESLNGTFGSSKDELEFKHMLSHPNFIYNFSISASNGYRDVIAAIPMDGFAGNVPNFIAAQANQTFTHQSFIMNLFENWLASISLNTHLFATQFHSLKLRFVVAPGHYTNSITGLEIDDSNSVVVNFGENSSHETKFPEITNRLFLRNRYSQSLANTTLYPPSSTNCLGYFFILIEVPLVLTNDIVSPTIFGMVEHYFDKFRFARSSKIPILPQNTIIVAPPPVVPTTTTTTTSKPEEQEEKPLKISLQIAPKNSVPAPPSANDLYHLEHDQLRDHQNSTLEKASFGLPPFFAAEVKLVDNLTDKLFSHSLISHSVYAESPHINSTHIHTDNFTASNLDPPKFDICAYKSGSGESITSLRQFLTQYTSPYLTDESPTERYLFSNPFSPAYVSDLTSDVQADRIDYLLSPFAFTKGSRHIRVYFPENYPSSVAFATTSTMQAGGNPRVVIISLPPPGRNFHSQRLIPIIRNLEGLADFHLPYYTNFNMLPNIDPANVLYDVPNLEMYLPPDNQFLLSRSCGEDISAGWLCGLPPYYVENGSSNFFPPILPS